MPEEYRGCIIESTGKELLEGIAWGPVCTIEFEGSDGRTKIETLFSDQTCGTEEMAIAAGIANAKHTIDSCFSERVKFEAGGS